MRWSGWQAQTDAVLCVGCRFFSGREKILSCLLFEAFSVLQLSFHSQALPSSELDSMRVVSTFLQEPQVQLVSIFMTLEKSAFQHVCKRVTKALPGRHRQDVIKFFFDYFFFQRNEFRYEHLLNINQPGRLYRSSCALFSGTYTIPASSLGQ